MGAITATQLKLQDAATQMRLAVAHHGTDVVFRSCINSYLSTSRSVTMVMEKESKDFHPDLLAWYKDQSGAMGAAPFFQFFNSQRVLSIHQGVVEPRKREWPVENFRVLSGRLTATGELTSSWEILSEESPADAGDVVTVMPDGRMVAWIFEDFSSVWPHHSGNVLSLCELHYLSIKGIVQGWLIERNRLTPATHLP